MTKHEYERVAAALQDMFVRFREMGPEERRCYITALRQLVQPRVRLAKQNASSSRSNVVQLPRRDTLPPA